MRPRNRTWSRASKVPFSPAEDADLIAMARCGLAIEFYKAQLPGRAFGDILARRLDLAKAGVLTMAPPL